MGYGRKNIQIASTSIQFINAKDKLRNDTHLSNSAAQESVCVCGIDEWFSGSKQ